MFAFTILDGKRATARVGRRVHADRAMCTMACPVGTGTCVAAQVVTAATPLNQQAGYYCKVCDCILRDSQSYLDHMCAAAGPSLLPHQLDPIASLGADAFA